MSIVVDISLEEQEKAVLEGIEKWKNGDLFISLNISEKDAILKPGEKIPVKENKDHRYNKFLDHVASEFASMFDLGKREKKGILRQLYSSNKRWQELILERVNPEDIKEESPPKKKIKKDPSSPKRKKLKKVKAKKNATQEVPKPPPKTRKKLTPEEREKLLAEGKQKFEEERDRYLKMVPKDVVERFGQICFTKWGSLTLPCLVLSPYSVPPNSTLRLGWQDMVENLKRQRRLPSCTNLVYWYGASDDLQNAYSYVTSKNLISYEVGVKRGLDQVPPPIQKKFDAGKPLPQTQLQLIDGLEEMRLDIPKAPKERSGYLENDFKEEYEAILDESEDEEEVHERIGSDIGEPDFDEPEPSTDQVESIAEETLKSEKKKAKKRKKVVEEYAIFAEVVEDPMPVKKRKKKKKPAVKEEQPVEVSPQVASDTLAVEMPAGTVLEVPDTLKEEPQDDDLSSREDPDADYNYAMAESGSDADADDEEFMSAMNTPAPSKVKSGAKTKLPPKKKATTSKIKIEKDRPKERKVVSEEKRRKMAQKAFRACEKAHMPLIREWTNAISNRDEDTILRIYKDLLGIVEGLHVSFITAYDFSPMMKQSKLIADSADRKQLMKALGKLYNEKKGTVPAGFKPIKLKDKELDNSTVQATPEAQDNVAPEKTSSTPSTEPTILETPGSSTLEKSTSSSSLRPKEPVKVERKKKFSLGRLCNPTTQSNKPAPSSKPNISDLVATKAPVVLPSWITNEAETSPPSDDTRAYALEFLGQAMTFIPESKNVNRIGIAQALEASTYEWVRNKDTISWTKQYWDKIDDIVSAISGLDSAGSIAGLIAEGKFKSPIDVIMLSDDAMYDSFLGKEVSTE
eukprot:Nitzschia sp. Nitz4//scaffold48_size128905//97811//100528//NITZ4_003615-RA/size128905-augustus-gene-0.12-mRNA-1//1//CDS//3329553027//5317//frame0